MKVANYIWIMYFYTSRILTNSRRLRTLWTRNMMTFAVVASASFFYRVTSNRALGNFTALFSTAIGLLLKTPSRRGDFSIRLSVVELFALDCDPLRSNELSIHSLNYQNKMQTSSKIAITLQRLLFAYHSTPSVIFVTKQMPGGGTFYCSIAWFPNQANMRRKSTWNRRHRS